MTNGRRGRPSHDDYARRVAEALRFDLFELDECSVLAQLPGVRAMICLHQHAVLPTGTALRAMLDEAVADIEVVAKVSNDPIMKRIAIFLQIWYREHDTVVRVSKVLGVSRSTVVHSVQPRAIELVAKRFLELAWKVEVPA